jgi:hypothetical protein
VRIISMCAIFRLKSVRKRGLESQVLATQGMQSPQSHLACVWGGVESILDYASTPKLNETQPSWKEDALPYFTHRFSTNSRRLCLIPPLLVLRLHCSLFSPSVASSTFQTNLLHDGGDNRLACIDEHFFQSTSFDTDVVITFCATCSMLLSEEVGEH